MKSIQYILPLLLPGTLAAQTIIPKTCFDSLSNFEDSFTYLYPWGSDHNGAAVMSPSQVHVSNGTLSLTAVPAAGERTASSGERTASSGGKAIEVKYRSGAVHSRDKFTVAAHGGYDFSADVKATTAKGTWPAFWLTAVKGWPPEIDMAEWKGNGKIAFNTFNTSREVASTNVAYPHPGHWHSIRTELRDLNGEDVGVKFYLNGELAATQTGKGFVGRAMWLILNLQMEGSSGWPGPMGNTSFRIRHLEVVSYNGCNETASNLTSTRPLRIRRDPTLVPRVKRLG